MKLNEKNLDTWLQGNLKEVNTLPDDSMLQTILIQTKADGRKRRMIFWINIILIAAWLTFYVNYRFGQTPKAQIIQTESEIVTNNITPNTKNKSSNASSNIASITNNDKQRITTPANDFKSPGKKAAKIASPIRTKYSKPPSIVKVEKSSYTPPFDGIPEIIKRIIQSFYKPQPPDDLNSFVPLKITTITGLALLQNANKDTGKKDKKFLKTLTETLLKPELGYGIGIGYTQSNSKITKSDFDPKFTNKEYQNMLSAGFGNNQGIQLDAGLRLGYAKMTIQGAVLYSHFQQTLNFEIPVKEVPVIDINGEIKGYIELQDSAQTTVLSKSKFMQNEIAIPLNISFKQKLPLAMSLELGMGILPKLRTYSDVELPGTADMLSPNITKLKPNLSMPITLRLGVYKNFNNFSAGFTGMFTPVNNSKSELPGQMSLSGKQSYFQFTLFKNL